MTPDPTGHPAPAPAFSDGQLEGLKWIALASMFLDHIGRLALGYAQDTWVFAGGRLAFPLFALVLAVNLAREGNRAERAARTALRLGLWCAVSVAPSIWARGEPQVVNVLGTLGLGAVLCWLMGDARLSPEAKSSSHALFLPLFLRLPLGMAPLLAASHVEFGMPGVLLVPAVYLAATHRLITGAALAAVCLALIALLNASFGGWPALASTLAVVPVARIAQRLPLNVPRLRHAFYVIYPVHLALIGAWRALYPTAI